MKLGETETEIFKYMLDCAKTNNRDMITSGNICKKVGISTTYLCYKHIDELQAHDLVKRDGRYLRNIEINEDLYNKKYRDDTKVTKDELAECVAVAKRILWKTREYETRDGARKLLNTLTRINKARAST